MCEAGLLESGMKKKIKIWEMGAVTQSGASGPSRVIPADRGKWRGREKVKSR